MRYSPTRLLLSYALLIGAVTSITYGVIAWHASAFAVDGVWFYDNEWHPHPVHFIAFGIGLAAPMLWDIIGLITALGERQRIYAQRRRDAAAAPAETMADPNPAGPAAPGAGPDAPTSASAPHTFIRPIAAVDQGELLRLAQEGRDLHMPWIDAPVTPNAFKAYFQRTQRPDHAGYAVCLRDGGEIVGVVNLNNIQGGTLRSASIAYYVAQRHVRKGYMREALTQVKAHAFQQLRLHRLEASIRPGNTASIALARSCGFAREGLAARLLYVDGAWRDHERWAAVDQRETLQ